MRNRAILSVLLWFLFEGVASASPRIFVAWKRPVDLPEISFESAARDRLLTIAGIPFNLGGERVHCTLSGLRLDGAQLRIGKLAITYEVGSLRTTIAVPKFKRQEVRFAGQRTFIDVPDGLENKERALGRLALSTVVEPGPEGKSLSLPDEISLTLNPGADGHLQVKLLDREQIRNQLRDSIERNFQGTALEDSHKFALDRVPVELRPSAERLLAQERPEILRRVREAWNDALDHEVFLARLETVLTTALPALAPLDHEVPAILHLAGNTDAVRAINMGFDYASAAPQCHTPSLCVLTDVEGFQWAYRSYLSVLTEKEVVGSLRHERAANRIRYIIPERERKGVAMGLAVLMGEVIDTERLRSIDVVATRAAFPSADLEFREPLLRLDLRLTLDVPVLPAPREHQNREVPLTATFYTDPVGVPSLTGLTLMGDAHKTSTMRLVGLPQTLVQALSGAVLSSRLGNLKLGDELRVVPMDYSEASGERFKVLRISGITAN